MKGLPSRFSAGAEGQGRETGFWWRTEQGAYHRAQQADKRKVNQAFREEERKTGFWWGTLSQTQV